MIGGGPDGSLDMGAPRSPEDSRWPNILLIVGAGVVSAFQVGKAPAALAAVQADLGLGLATASWLLSAFALVGASAGVAVGVAVDHVGARRMVIGGLLLQGVSGAAGALAGGAPLLLATRAIEGIGFLTVTVAAPTLIVAMARPRDLGRAIAVWGTFMPVGITLVMLGAPLLAATGWRGFWLVNAAILIGYAALLALGTRFVPPGGAPRRSIAADLRQTLAAGGPWLLAGLMAAFAAVFFAVFGFLPLLLSDRLAVGPETGSLLTALAMAANVLGNLGCGLLLARGVRRSHILLVGLVTMALCSLGILGEAVPGALAYALCIVFSAVGGLVPVALIDGAPRHAPRPELVGATMGFLMQGNNAGIVVGPAAAGALASGFGWPGVSLVVAGAGLAAGLVALALREPPAEASLFQEPLPTSDVTSGPMLPGSTNAGREPRAAPVE
jgi:MFS transporter, DHA1 family, inner membrane transport protein